MPKRNDELPWWLVALGVAGGGFALAALLAEANKPPSVFQCWNCGTHVNRGAARCPACGVTFDWNRAPQRA
jgi:hypothetical protein